MELLPSCGAFQFGLLAALELRNQELESCRSVELGKGQCSHKIGNLQPDIV